MLTFYYGSMNSSKSSSLIQLAHNYENQGIIIEKYGYRSDYIESRCGLKASCTNFQESTNFWENVEHSLIRAILIDEAQFLTETQVAQLCCIVDKLDISVWCYGLRSDYIGQPFIGSTFLMSWADKLIELPAIDGSGNMSRFQIRLDKNGNRSFNGPKISLGRQHYEPVSRKEFELDKIYQVGQNEC